MQSRIVLGAAIQEAPMTENCIARTGDLHFCPLPGHGVTPIVTGEPWVTVAGQSVACTDDETGCGAALIGSAGFFQINGRPVVRRGDSSSHAGVVVDGAEFFTIRDRGNSGALPV